MCHFGAQLPRAEKMCDTQHLDYHESLYLLLLSDQMLVAKSLAEGIRPLFIYLFILTFHPVCCELAALNRALFEVLCEHKSLLIKVPRSENDLNKHKGVE